MLWLEASGNTTECSVQHYHHNCGDPDDHGDYEEIGSYMKKVGVVTRKLELIWSDVRALPHQSLRTDNHELINSRYRAALAAKKTKNNILVTLRSIVDTIGNSWCLNLAKCHCKVWVHIFHRGAYFPKGGGGMDIFCTISILIECTWLVEASASQDGLFSSLSSMLYSKIKSGSLGFEKIEG